MTPEAVALRRALEPLLEAAPERDDWPLVSIIVATRDGLELLEALLDGLELTTDYPCFEVIVVDNGSTDGTWEFLRSAELSFPLLLARNWRNLSFAATNNIGAARARGTLLLFCNNDVEPVEPGWLRRLVSGLERHHAGVAGALLVDPDRESASGAPVAVQHRAIGFRYVDGFLRPTLKGLNDDVERHLGVDQDCAGVVAACMLVRRPVFEAVGGFCELYWYGGEDTDLCLTIGSLGLPVLASGSTVLLHRATSTRGRMWAEHRELLISNQRLLLERWGPRIAHEHALDRRAGAGRWSDATAPEPDADLRLGWVVVPLHADVAASARELADELAAIGVRVHCADDPRQGLLDHVVVHVRADVGRGEVVSNRLTVLVLCGEREPPAAERSRYQLTIPRGDGADALVREVGAAFAALGLPRGVRVRP